MISGQPNSENPVQEDFVLVGSMRIFLRRSGNGKPLVLIHGLGGPQTWRRVLPELAATFQVLAPDLPGFGKSDCPPRGFSVAQYADFVADLLDALSVRRCALAGMSFGGEIAVAFAARHPERLERMILISSTGLHSRRWIRAIPLFPEIIGFVLKSLVFRSRLMLDLLSRRAYYDRSTRPPDMVTLFHNDVADGGKRDAWVDAMWNVFFPPEEFRIWLKGLRVPVLILWGEEDRAVPVRLAGEFQLLAGGAELVTVPECAHAMPLETPSVLCGEFTKFLAPWASGR